MCASAAPLLGLASGSDGETIKLWDIKMGECLKTFRSEGYIKGMNITEALQV